MSDVRDEGYIYLIWTRASKNIGEFVYKLGRTKQKNPKKRFSYYMKGYDEIIKIWTDNVKLKETKLKELFKNKFEKDSSYGYEYFKGDKNKMVKLIKKIAKKKYRVLVIDFADLIIEG